LRLIDKTLYLKECKSSIDRKKEQLRMENFKDDKPTSFPPRMERENQVKVHVLKSGS
jgi:hypothetical protein